MWPVANERIHLCTFTMVFFVVSVDLSVATNIYGTDHVGQISLQSILKPVIHGTAVFSRQQDNPSSY